MRRYWHLPRERTPRPAAPEARIREWVDESVKTHLVSDVPIAVFLSGGLDSSTVLASMSLGGERPHAFTARYIGSGQEGADETGLALIRRAGYDPREMLATLALIEADDMAGRGAVFAWESHPYIRDRRRKLGSHV